MKQHHPTAMERALYAEYKTLMSQPPPVEPRPMDDWLRKYRDNQQRLGGSHAESSTEEGGQEASAK